MSIGWSVDCIEEGYLRYQGKPEGCGDMTPRNVTTINLSVTTSYVLMSEDNTDDESVWTRATVETLKPP